MNNEYGEKRDDLDIKDKNIKKSKIEKNKIEKCNVLWIDNEKIGFNFMGHGVFHKAVIEKNKKEVEVKYKGTIGKKDFEIISVK